MSLCICVDLNDPLGCMRSFCTRDQTLKKKSERKAPHLPPHFKRTYFFVRFYYFIIKLIKEAKKFRYKYTTTMYFRNIN